MRCAALRALFAKTTFARAMFAMTMIVIPVARLASQEARPANVPIRELSTPTATSSEYFKLIMNVRGLPDGKLLVNDAKRHKLMLLDAQLRTSAVVLDSVSGASQGYGGGYTPIIPYLGDSTLYADGDANTLVMIAPDGTIGRAVAPPVPQGWFELTLKGGAADARGNLVYRMNESAASTSTRDTAALRKAFTQADSFLVVRASFDTRKLDTLGRVRFKLTDRATVTVTNGMTVIAIYDQILPTPDDYAVLSDGSVAFVRGHDYHVDIIQPNGQRTAGPKLPFDWKRLTDAEKESLVDSANAKNAPERNAGALRIAAGPAGGRAGLLAGVASAGGRGVPSGAVTNAASVPAFDRSDRVITTGLLDVSHVPDYYPPIRTGAAKADMDANLWVLPTTTAQSKNGELIYDVVNNKGELTERVRIPAGRAIAGFGKNGVVYLMIRDAKGWQLERTILRR